MISRLQLLRNIGLFDSVDSGANLPLARLTLVYAENGRGKTTLAAVLRSLATGDPIPIAERRRLAAQHPPHLVVTHDGPQSPAVFQNNAWNSVLPNMVVFDDVFVDQNVSSGLDDEDKNFPGLTGGYALLTNPFVIEADPITVDESDIGVWNAVAQFTPMSLIAWLPTESEPVVLTVNAAPAGVVVDADFTGSDGDETYTDTAGNFWAIGGETGSALDSDHFASGPTSLLIPPGSTIDAAIPTTDISGDWELSFKMRGADSDGLRLHFGMGSDYGVVTQWTPNNSVLLTVKDIAGNTLGNIAWMDAVIPHYTWTECRLEKVGNDVSIYVAGSLLTTITLTGPLNIPAANQFSLRNYGLGSTLPMWVDDVLFEIV